MCLIILPLLALLLVIGVWLYLGLDAKNAIQAKDIRSLQDKLKDCQTRAVEKAIAEKASAWRRDRRSGDNPNGVVIGYDD